MPIKNNITSKQKKYRHINQTERLNIEVGLNWKKPVKEIATKIGKHRSTIYREIKRNNNTSVDYNFHDAQIKYKNRIKNAHIKESLKNILIKNYVEKHLKLGWSPEQIAGRLPLDHPGESTNYESIYLYIYSHRPDLIVFLPKSHKKRKKRGKKTKKQSRIPLRVSIEERPEIINKREEIGHWEADTMISRITKSSSLTVLHERKKGFVLLKKISEHNSESMAKAIENLLKKVPQEYRKSITYDNGAENFRHFWINIKYSMKSYFCNPYHSWEKGSVENSIGLIRRYLPKKTNLDLISDKYIKKIEKALNNRPRKRLGFKTPAEVFREELVALNH